MFSRERFTTVTAYRGFVTTSQLLETLFTRNYKLTKVGRIQKGGLKFSRKATAAVLHRNYWKIINFLTAMPNVGRRQFADDDVGPNPPYM